jgi:hypothetical protein
LHHLDWSAKAVPGPIRPRMQMEIKSVPKRHGAGHVPDYLDMSESAKRRGGPAEEPDEEKYHNPPSDRAMAVPTETQNPGPGGQPLSLWPRALVCQS